jgi:S1-C subfamily serine protease
MKEPCPRLLIPSLLYLLAGSWACSSNPRASWPTPAAQEWAAGSEALLPFGAFCFSGLTWNSEIVVVFVTPRFSTYDIRPGDRILTANGAPLALSEGWADWERNGHPGDTVRLSVRRAGDELDRLLVCESGAPYSAAMREVMAAYIRGDSASCFSAVRRLESFIGPSEYMATLSRACGDMGVTMNQMALYELAPLYHRSAQRALVQAVVAGTVGEVRTYVITTATALRNIGSPDLARDVTRLLEEALQTEDQSPRVVTAPSDQPFASLGSGFVLPSRLLAATNYHVIEGAAVVEVWSPVDGNWHLSRVVRSDAANDLALIEVPEALRPPLSASVYGIRSATEIRVGAQVHAIGFPLSDVLGSRPRFTTGTISADVGIADDPRLVQTTASIQPGNSGGPLVDAFGQVAGVVVSTLNSGLFLERTGSVPQNVNFAIKIDYLRLLAGDDFGAPGDRPPLALQGSDVAERMAPWVVRIRATRN